MTLPLHVVLVAPEIPQNTGNIGRMCAVTKSRLHLIHPLGFTISDRHLRRAGMDYWRTLDVHEHASLDAMMQSPVRPARLWYLSPRGQQSFWNVRFAPGDGLVLGCESRGLSESTLAEAGEGQTIFVDQPNPEMRSLNLATCAGIVTYEALRQLRFNLDT